LENTLKPWLLTIAVVVCSSVSLAQNPKGQNTARDADIYHVNFSKAALGKASALASSLKTPDPKAPMPGHILVLRHLDGDSWDYATIEHLGTKATVDLSTPPPPPALRDLRAWHNDTFVSGPPWAEFVKAMGVGTSNTANSIYVVDVQRAAPGHREQLEALLRQRPATNSKVAGSVVLTHLEGGNWNFVAIDRYNSWQDLAASESNDRAAMLKGQGGWFDIRNHSDFHADTFADRITP
jgi:hypothetical protein